MKRNNSTILIIASMLLLSSFSLKAQENEENKFKSIFKNKPSFGGYGIQQVGYTKINGLNTISLKIGGAISINKKLGMGFVISPFFTENPEKKLSDGKQIGYNGAYGGFFLEPVFFYENPIHFSIPIILGGGSISMKNEYNNNYSTSSTQGYNYEWSNRWEDYLIVEPGINMGINLMRFLKITAGISYRITTDVSLDMVDSNGTRTTIFKKGEMNGLNIQLGFKVGIF